MGRRRGAVDDEVERVLALSDEDLDAELKQAGADPEKVRERGEALGRKLAPGGNASTVTPWTRRVVWLAAAALGVLVVSFAAVSFSGIMARFRPLPIGPDEGGLSVPPEALAREQAATLREQGLAECVKGTYEACQQHLDAAMQLDPAGETDPRVVRAREGIAAHEKPGKPRLRSP
ncbi:MAG TPA: hypothetical protein VIJ22_17910 [Polyangiaceae bacterium]